MIALDITNSPFMKVHCGETNDWLSENVGELIHDDPEISYGKGWRITFDPAHEGEGRWIAEFEEERHAMLFLLRWS